MDHRKQAMCPGCGSDRIQGYWEDENLFALDCVDCAESEMKELDKEINVASIFTDWF